MNREHDMSELDGTDLARDLFDRLAATMPDNPKRASAVQQLVRRRHRRRVATRATIGVACVAGVGAALVAGTSLRPASPSPVTPAASTPTKTEAPATTAPGQDPCQEKAATVGDSSTPPATSSDGRFKGDGTVTAVDGDVISVAIHDSTIAITHLTATIASDASYLSAGDPVTTRPSITVGQHVAFGVATRPDGSFEINLLEVDPIDPDADAPKVSTAGAATSAGTRPANPGCSG